MHYAKWLQRQIINIVVEIELDAFLTREESCYWNVVREWAVNAVAHCDATAVDELAEAILHGSVVHDVALVRDVVMAMSSDFTHTLAAACAARAVVGAHLRREATEAITSSGDEVRFTIDYAELKRLVALVASNNMAGKAALIHSKMREGESFTVTVDNGTIFRELAVDGIMWVCKGDVLWWKLDEAPTFSPVGIL